jgi:hypothetical protein
VTEFASAPFDSPESPNWWPNSKSILPDIEKARKEPTYTWVKLGDEVAEELEMETVDRLINFVPSSGGAKW